MGMLFYHLIEIPIIVFSIFPGLFGRSFSVVQYSAHYFSTLLFLVVTFLDILAVLSFIGTHCHYTIHVGNSRVW